MDISGIANINAYQLSANKTAAKPDFAASFADAMAAATGSSETSTEKNSKTSDLTAAIIKKKDATKEFMDYMKMTPAERMQYAWLAQHGISKQDFDAMSPEDKQKLMDKMKEEIEMRAKMELEKKNADILV